MDEMGSYRLSGEQKHLLRKLVALSQAGKLPREFFVLTFQNPKKYNSFINQIQLEGQETFEFEYESDLEILCSHNPPLIYARTNNKTGTGKTYTITQEGFDAVESNFQLPRTSIRTEETILDRIPLEEEQKDLLAMLVEAARNVPRDQRREFMIMWHVGSREPTLSHPGLPGKRTTAHMGDVDVLRDAGLIQVLRDDRGSRAFDVHPLGFKYYDEMRRQSSEPIFRVESEIRRYVDSERFQQAFPNAYKKWAEAEELLWSSDSESQATTIGHLCREAMQEFVTALVERFQPPDVDHDIAHTVARLRAVLDIRKEQLSKTERPFLDALLAYFGTLCDLIQRQEHGGQREGEPLIWADTRRVIFQTAVVIFEIDASLSSTW